MPLAFAMPSLVETITSFGANEADSGIMRSHPIMVLPMVVTERRGLSMVEAKAIAAREDRKVVVTVKVKAVAPGKEGKVVTLCFSATSTRDVINCSSRWLGCFA